MNQNKDGITPEERLLNLIRHAKKKHVQRKDSSQVGDLTEKQSPSKSLSFSESQEIVGRREQNIIFAGIKSLNFVLINRLILATTIFALLLLLFDFFFHSSDFSKPQYSSSVSPEDILLENNETKPYSYYQQEIAKRQLFTSSVSESQIKRVIPAGQTFKELIKDLKLLGIISKDNAQVIIEDTKLQKTYFLYVGDYLGDMKVEEIYSDKVILEYKGERISLFL